MNPASKIALIFLRSSKARSNPFQRDPSTLLAK